VRSNSAHSERDFRWIDWRWIDRGYDSKRAGCSG
jgi:hypothetical protein